MDNGNINSGQVVGLRLLSDASDVNSRMFEARFVGGDPNYTLVGNPNQATTIGFSREGLHCEYTFTGPTTFSITITRLENNVPQTLTGTNVNANSIVALAFKNQFAGSGSAANGYLNNIAVTPGAWGARAARDERIAAGFAALPGLSRHCTQQPHTALLSSAE